MKPATKYRLSTTVAGASVGLYFLGPFGILLGGLSGFLLGEGAQEIVDDENQ